MTDYREQRKIDDSLRTWRIRELEEALDEALGLCEGLAMQQAMADDWWEGDYNRLRTVLMRA